MNSRLGKILSLVPRVKRAPSVRSRTVFCSPAAVYVPNERSVFKKEKKNKKKMMCFLTILFLEALD